VFRVSHPKLEIVASHGVDFSLLRLAEQYISQRRFPLALKDKFQWKKDKKEDLKLKKTTLKHHGKIASSGVRPIGGHR
jgi:hypothetical protein